MAKTTGSAYSVKNVATFINDNFGIIFISFLFFVGGFLIGSLWTENQMMKSARLSADGNAAPTADAVNNEPAPSKLTRDNLLAYASDLKVNKNKFEQCVSNKEIEKKILDQTNTYSAASINSTPTTVVVVNGVPKDIVSGALPFEQVKTILDKHLNDPNAPANVGDLKMDAFPAVSNTDHLRGNKNAKIVLVEHSDYECPYCQRFHPTMLQVMDKYKNDVAWVYRHFPLTSIHPNALPAAVAAECVNQEKGPDAFWKFSDQLMS